MIIALLGLALRVWGLVDGRSLWMDEALLAWNLCTRSFAGLLRPLDLNQAAPIGFLLVERLAVAILGPNEFALRLFPCLASIATMALAYGIARDHISRESATIALALTAVSPGLLYYGAEVKQYASDAAIALGIVALAANILHDGPSLRRLVMIAPAGMLAVWFSHPSVFVLAGAGSVLILTDDWYPGTSGRKHSVFFFRRTPSIPSPLEGEGRVGGGVARPDGPGLPIDPPPQPSPSRGEGERPLAPSRMERPQNAEQRQPYAIAAVVGCWAVSFAASYAVSLRSIRSNAFLNDFWRFAFLPVPPRSLSDLLHYPSTFLGLFDAAFRDFRPQFLLDATALRALSILGMVGWLMGVVAFRRRGRWLSLLIAPLGFAVLAAMLQKYPLRSRMVMFDVGLNLVVIAAGLAAASRSPRATVRWVGRGMTALLILIPLFDHMMTLSQRQPARYGIAPVVAELARSFEPGDRIYVDSAAEPTFRHVLAFGDVEGMGSLGGAVSFGEPPRDDKSRRFWIVTEGELTPGALDLLRRSGRPLATIESRGAMVGRPARAALYGPDRIPFTTEP